MKTCSRCGQTKPLDAFYASQKSRHCKACKAEIYRAYRKTEKGHEVHRLGQLKYRHTPHGLAAGKANLERNMVKFKARQAVHRAKKKGKLKEGPCADCGTTVNVHGHHEDYTRKLDVTWLCSDCHWRRHREERNSG